ncbi:MAG: hypothetical protein WCP29_02220 [Acidobacteriota bacterium]
METEAKTGGVAVGATSAIGGLDADRIAALSTALREMVERVEENIPLSSIRQAYAEPLDDLVSVAGQSRDVNMLARLHSVMSMLEAEEAGAGQKAALVGQIGQVERMLHDRPRPSAATGRGIIADHAAMTAVDLPVTMANACEGLLRSMSSIGDEQIAALREKGLLDEERLLNTDPLELATIAGVPTNTAFEIKEILRRELGLRAKRDLERRVAELSRINEQLGMECDGLSTANNTLVAGNKVLKSEYPLVSEQHDIEVANFKDLQSRVVSARLESNRLATEINFLRDEHRALLDVVEEKHVVLDDLLRRFNGVRSSFEFVSGETAAAEDVMTNVEGLLKKALLQKKVLNDRIASSEESLDKLLSEFNAIVKKGKTEFYRSI